jgi:adenosylmethionine-8-amino-7-oxononanoate aminotransferase
VRLACEIEALSHVAEVRRWGMMVGIELMQDPTARRPYPRGERIGHRVIRRARARGVIIRPLGDVVVLMPPLSITDGEIDRLVAVTREAIVDEVGA